MASNSLGRIFRITTSGESHGKGMGVIIDGCPAGIVIDNAFIQRELDRRRPGQSSITTQRKESDAFIIQSGVYEGKTTGAPILILIPNEDTKPADYDHIENSFSHHTRTIPTIKNTERAIIVAAADHLQERRLIGLLQVLLQN